jgi:hypothetical protein
MGLFISCVAYAGVFVLAHDLPIANYLGLMVCCIALNVAYAIKN